jgi:hypothetical protein
MASHEGMRLNEQAGDGWPFYLVVLRGPFTESGRFSDAPPRSIATLILTPTAKYPREFDFRNDLPRAISLLGTPHTISLDASSG